MDKNENTEQESQENSVPKKDVPLVLKIIFGFLSFFLVAILKECITELGPGKGNLLSLFIIGAVVGVAFLLDWGWRQLKTWIKNR